MDSEVDAAMIKLDEIAELAQDSANYRAIRKLFDAVNIKIFIKFARVPRGKRVLNKPIGGIITSGNQPPPIELYRGPTARKEVKAALTDESSNSYASTDPGTEDKSLGNVNRGDWQNLERDIQPYVLVFVNGPDPVLLRIAGMLRQSA